MVPQLLIVTSELKSIYNDELMLNGIIMARETLKAINLNNMMYIAFLNIRAQNRFKKLNKLFLKEKKEQ